jgi:hypothetical protein
MVLAAGLIGYGLFNLYTGRQYQYMEFTDNWRQLAEETTALAEPEDTVLTLATPFAYYYGPGAQVIVDTANSPERLERFVRDIHSERVIVQYSPLSGWGHIDFAALGRRVDRALKSQGYRREWIRRYGRDFDADLKRRFLVGRSLPDYRHRLALYVRAADADKDEPPDG